MTMLKYLSYAVLILSLGACATMDLKLADPSWRGLHVLDGGASGLPELKRLISQSLAPAGCNVLVYEIGYNYRFQSHPEIPQGSDVWTKEQVRDLVAYAGAAGIKVIPEINCLGHQSWKEPPGDLLKSHPAFEEPADGSSPQATMGKEFYCRSWCPRHPELNPLMFSLMDELLDAFQSDCFHAGMDEVFIIASKNCPRCKGADPAALFAGQVNAFHGHLQAKGAKLLIWADRLLDGEKTGYGAWEGSLNGTSPALDMIPKDVLLCDWHYDGGAKGAFPSLELFSSRGFKVWPTTFKTLEHSLAFLRASGKNPAVAGVLTSIWYPGNAMQAALEGKGTADQRKIAECAIQTLKRASGI
jgi:hypothetical protein